jgi:hypothetical protein
VGNPLHTPTLLVLPPRNNWNKFFLSRGPGGRGWWTGYTALRLLQCKELIGIIEFLKHHLKAGVSFMAKDRDSNGKDRDPFSDSGELFESIFREAIAADETKKEKKGRGDTEKGRGQDKVTPKEATRVREKGVERKTTTKKPFQELKKPEKPRKPEKPKKLEKIKIPKKAGHRKGSGSRKLAVPLFIFLALGAGFYFYGDVLPLGLIKDTVSSVKQKITGPDQTKVAVSRKKAVPEKASSKQVKKARTERAPQASAGRKENKTEQALRPKTIQKNKPTPPPKVITKSTQAEKIAPAPSPPSPKKEPPLSKTAPPALPQRGDSQLPQAKTTANVTAATAQSRTAEADAAASEQTQARPAQVQKTPMSARRELASSYPYSIYLGAYKTLNRAKRAVVIHQDQGLSPYWVKVDLGDKGVWYRIFEGHFTSQEAAEAFVREKRLEEAEVKRTRYTNLIGVYSTTEDLRSRSFALLERGYCPYVIQESNGDIALYAGAFYTREGAETQHRELVSQGIQNQVVSR